MKTLAQLRYDQQTKPQQPPTVREECEPEVQPIPQFEPGRDYTIGRGFTRLLPPGVKIELLTPEWIAENWFKPSAWCNIEGYPEHPDFTLNVAKV